MAIYDYTKANRDKECKEKYEELKSFLLTPGKNGKLNEYYSALNHIFTMEKEIEDLRKENNAYKGFFSTLQSFLPKSISPNNKY